MSWSSKDILYLIEMIIYIGLMPCIIFTAVKHGRRSILGHIYFVVFCGMRIVADAMLVSERGGTPSTTALIINSIGLSPLLLATLGFAGEVQAYVTRFRRLRNSPSITFLIEAVMHANIVAGVAILASGMATAYRSNATETARNSALTQAKAGAFVLLLGWFLVSLRAVVVFRWSKEDAEQGQRLPRLLATEILVAVPFVGIRTVYTVVEIFNVNASPALANFATVFFLLFLSQLIAVAILAVALLLTTKITQESDDRALVSREHQTQAPLKAGSEHGRDSQDV